MLFRSSFGSDPWQKMRESELKLAIRSIYEIEPKIFAVLNKEQKTIMVSLLNLILEEGNRERVLEILKKVVEISDDERNELCKILRTTRLSNVIKTLKMIEDRFQTIEGLREIVFNKSLNANEIKHLQSIIESHYWVFGEQYYLVTAAEPKFEEALRRYTYLLNGEITDRKIDHDDKNREMDIFMCRQDKYIDNISNIVVELKSPTVNLGAKELEQVKKYMGVILKQSEFNAANMTWEFYLVGDRFDTSGYLEGELANAKSHGERFLVFSNGSYKIYVMKWSEIFSVLECRYKFLTEKLKIERDKITGEETETANNIVLRITTNSAVLSPQLAGKM